MEIRVGTLNSLLSVSFRGAISGYTYKLKLLFDGEPSESSTVTISFATPSGGQIGLSSSLYFPIESGTEVIGVHVLDSANNLLIEEAVNPPEVFPNDGTFTINNIIVKLV